jgi:hypothetical protein
MRLRIVSLIVLALSHTPVPAQSTFASITGSVSDSTGALMPGVQIEVREINTGYTYKAETNENGLYTIANIREGTFTLRASKAGFADFTVDKVLLTALDNRRVDVRLQVGTVGTTVEVSGGATLIETESARIADVKDRETMRALPLTLRRAWDYFTLSPQINKTTAGFQVSFAGSRQQQGAANIDGTTIQRSGGGFASGPLLDRTESFSELRMDISGTSAEFGQIGQVTLISRAGTNDFHGTYSDYYSTTAFRVRNPFALERSSGVSHRMTFAAGGPIIIPKIYNGRNKTFVFGTLEIGFGSPGRTQINQSVPAVPWRSGDFSSLLPGTVVRDPLNGNEPFPNNRIPANRINPAAKILQDEFLALPNFGDPNTFAALNYRELRTNIVAHQPTLTLRVDHRFNDKAFIYGRLTKVDWNLNNWESLPTIKDRYERSRTLRAATIAYTHSLKPNLLNEFRWGSSYDNLPNVSAINGKQLVERLGLRGLAPDLPDVGGIVETSFTGVGLSPITVLGTCKPCGRDLIQQFLDHVNWFRGNHNLKMGYQLIWGAFNEIRQPAGLFGNLNFSNRFSGHPYSDFLLGVPTTMSRGFPAIEPQRRSYRHGIFVQDDWRVTPRLTLNLGLRWDYFPGFTEKNGRQAIFDIASGAIVVPDGALNLVSPLMPRGYVDVLEASKAGYAASTLTRGDKNNLAPRFGFAWRPTSDNRSVVRGGFGIYYDAAPFAAAVGSTVPFNISEPAYTNPVNAPLVLPVAFPGSGSGGPSTVAIPNAFRPDLRIPFSMQYSLTLERQQWNNGFRLSYVGTNTRQGVYRWDINSPVADARNYIDKPRRFPRYPGINYTDNGAGHQYHGMSFEVERRRLNGLSYQAYYTLAKDVQDLENGESPEYAYDRARERSTWGALPRHRFQFNTVYDLPVGKGRPLLATMNRAAEAIFGGWQVSVIYIYETGNTMTPLWTGPDPTGTRFSANATRPQVTIRPDRIADGRLDNPTNLRWFDVGAFQAPPAGRFGTSGKYVLYGVPVNVLHATVAKQFLFKERVRLRLEMLASNALNHPNYLDPNTNITNLGTVGVLTAVMDRNTKFDSAVPRELQAQLRLEW